MVVLIELDLLWGGGKWVFHVYVVADSGRAAGD